jgi:RNA polymerase sigma-70 factor (family 1)
MASKKSLTDFELIELVKGGDHAAFTEIYNRYWDVMFIHTIKMLRDEDEAKDLVQELFASFWAKSSTIEIKSNLSGYLYIAIRHKILNHIRQRKASDDFISLLGIYIEEHQNTTVELLNEKDLALALDREIMNLPAKMRQIFELSRKQKLSHKEIASELDISDKTVKKQISNALKIIRSKINDTARIFIFA